MQNNIVVNEEEALRNAGVTQHLPGQHHHHHHAHGTTVEGVPLVGNQILTNPVDGSYIPTAGTVMTGTEYISGPQVIGTTQLGGVPLTGTGPYNTTGLVGGPYTTTGLVGGPYTTTGNVIPTSTLTGTSELLGAGALGAGVTGGLHHHHHHGVAGTTGLPTTGYGTTGLPTTGYGTTGLPTTGYGTTGLPTTGYGTTGLPATGLAPTTGLTPNTALTGTGQGTFVFRPIEGKFLKDKDPIGKMDCYCKFKIGLHSGKSAVAKSEGTHPVWNDAISLNRKHNEQFAKLKIKDKDRLTLNDKVGEVKIPLSEIAAKGRVQQWFNVYKKDQLAGEILLDVEYQPRTVF